jgi:4-amino-4-deoxy-L-arabinose transferase-like glycosyltransferase
LKADVLNHLIKSHIFWLLTLCVAFLSVLPSLVQDGMFMDGVQYAAVSKNLAEGKSTFWLPYLNSAWDRHHVKYFLEHPPLVYFLQSLFFLLFGNGFISERIYCIAMLLLCIFLISKIWKLLYGNEERIARLAWLPVLLWISIPSVPWSFRSNMHENTLSVFILASSLFTLKAVHSEKNIFYIFLSAIFIFLATLSKGLQGLFPLAMPLLYWLTAERFPVRRLLLFTFFLLFIPALIYGLCYTFSADARFSLEFYVKHRLLDRISNDPLVDNHFTVLLWLLTDLIVPAGVGIFFLVIFRMMNIRMKRNERDRKNIFFFSLYALSGIVPLTLTLVQRAVYFVPAMPFVAIALSVFFAGGMADLADSIREKNFAFKSFKVFAMLLACGIIFMSVYLYSKPGRDETELKNSEAIAQALGENKVIGASFETYTKWGFQFYLTRYYNITLDASPQKYEFLLLEMNKDTSGYEKIRTGLAGYNLYRKIN